MRKSFFKKLSFGMALALVLGTTAHAGVAQAAETWTLKKDSKILYLNEDNQSNTKNFYDFNFKNKPENWKKDYSFAWSIADEEVATVAKGGVVTAVSVGKTVVSCEITNKETGAVEVVKADVTVKANAAEVVINNAADYGVEYGWFIPTGTTIDLNRTMFDENGNSTTKRGVYVSDYTRWLATDMDGNVVAEDVVAINQANGEFTFNVAGSYYLWCETYQSAANPDATAYDYFAVTVADEEVEITAAQTTVDTFEITFSAGLDATEFVKADFDAALVVENADENTELVKKTELVYNEDKTLVTGVAVTLWDDFNHNKEYKVVCGELEAVFTASVGKVKDIVIEVAKTGKIDAVKDANVVYVVADGKVETNTLKMTFFDAAGIDVTANYKDSEGNLMLDNVKFTTDGDEDYIDFDEDELTVTVDEDEDVVGKQLKIKAEYIEVDDEGNDVTVGEGYIVVTAQMAPAAKLTDIQLGVISANDTPAYNKEQYKNHKTIIAAEDAGLYIAVSAKDNWGNTIGNQEVEGVGKFTFAVNDNQIAQIDEETGEFTPNKEGKVHVNVFYTDLSVEEPKAVKVDKLVVTIKKVRELSTLDVASSKLELDSNVVVVDGKITETVAITDDVTFKFTVKDNHGETVTNLTASDFVITSEDAKVEAALADAEISYNGDAKAYVLKVTNTQLRDAVAAAKNPKKTVNLEFTVALANKDTAKAKKTCTVSVKPLVNTEITKYEVAVADKNVAMTNTADAKVEIVVYGLNKDGVRVQKIENFKFVATKMDDYIKSADKDKLPAANELFGDAATGTALVYTITNKAGKLVNATGDAYVEATSSGSMTLKSGNVMGVSGSSITLATTATGSSFVYTVGADEYTITIYKIEKSEKSSGGYKFKQTKVCDDTFKVTDSAYTVNAEQVSTTTKDVEVPNLGKKLAWTNNESIKKIVTDCYKFTLSDKVNEADTEAMDMYFEVRTNGNSVYVKTVRIFYEVNGEIDVLEKSIGKTISVTE